MSTTNPRPYYIGASGVMRSRESGIAVPPERALDCVNACAEMEDPAAQIKEAREILSGLVNHCIRHGRQVMLPQIQDALRALGG